MTRSDCPTNAIHVVCIADARYGAYAGITLASVLSAHPDDAVHLHLFSDGIGGRDIKRAAAMAHKAGAGFSLHDIREKLDEFPALPKRVNHYTRTSFGRLFFPEFLPSSIGRALYLDCDIICVASLRELWEIGQNIKLLAAARDTWVDADRGHKRSLGIPEDHPYFNAGVLLVNIEAWHRRNIADRVRKFLSRELGKHADQDVINGTLWEEITEIPRCWNLLITSPRAGEVPQQLATAANIHFCGGLKPWHFGYRLLGGAAFASFRQAKARSPWRWMPPDFQLGRLKRKIRQRMRPSQAGRTAGLA